MYCKYFIGQEQWVCTERCDLKYENNVPRPRLFSDSQNSGWVLPNPRIGNFRQKNYSAEDGIDGTTGLSRRNSGCSAEEETLGIPFRTTPQRRKMFGILYRETKIEASPWNSVPNHSAEEKPARIPFRGTKLVAT
jgi:hypothetical protein